jgi:hypothetical protein
MSLFDARRQNEMQVCGVHIAVRQNRILSQDGKGCDNTSFSGPALAADNDHFFHLGLSCPRQFTVGNFRNFSSWSF